MTKLGTSMIHDILLHSNSMLRDRENIISFHQASGIEFSSQYGCLLTR